MGKSSALTIAALLALIPLKAALAAPPIAAYYVPKMPVSKIPAEKLSYVIYAFAHAGDDNLCAKPTSAQKKTFAQLRKLRDAHPHLRVLFSIGGWNAVPEFSDIALTPESRAAFAKSCIQRYIVGQGFDGMDLDWEFPVHGGLNESRPSDRKHFTALTREIRQRLNQLGETNDRHYLLTAATPAARYEKGGRYKVTDSYNLAALEPLLDWFNVMTYDMSTIFSPVSGFNAPLHANPDDPTPDTQRKAGNIAGAVAFYEDHGVAASKIMLGFAFYGHGFEGVSADNAGVYSKYDKGFPHVAWKKIQSDFLTDPAWVRHWSETAQSPWLYNADKHIFFSYDDPMSIAIKADFARRKNLKGAMIWVLGQDNAQHSLLNALAAHIHQ